MEVEYRLIVDWDEDPATMNRVIALAFEQSSDVLATWGIFDREAINFDLAVCALFVDPHGPERLIKVEGVNGWSVDMLEN